MKKIVILLSLMMILTACQKTPEELVVQNKAENNYLDILEEESSIEETAEVAIEEQQNIFENYPTQWTESFTAKGKNINIQINADIEVPCATQIPIYEVVPQKITQEQVDNFLSEYGEVEYFLAYNFYTKDYYEEQILEMQKYLSVELPNKDCDEETRERLQEEYESGIENYTKKMQEAPEAIGEIVNPIFTSEYVIQYAEQNDSVNNGDGNSENTKIREYYENNNIEAINVKWIYNDDEMILSAQRSDCLTFNSLSFGVVDNTPVSIEDMVNAPTLHENEADIDGLMPFIKAKALAEDAINQRMGIEYLSVAHSFTDGECYMFIFSRSIDGINCTYCSNDIAFTDAYDEPWFYENIYVEVDEIGISMISSQTSMSSLGETISENATLLSFEKIKEIAKEQFSLGNIVLNSYYATEDVFERLSYMELLIDEIVFGYQRVKMGDGSGRYCLVPSWNFFGSCLIESEYGDGAACINDSKDLDYYGIYRHSYLTINAIDGSIIDRSLGY